MEPATSSALGKAVLSITTKAFEKVAKKSFNSAIEKKLLNDTDFRTLIEDKILFEEFPEIEIKPLISFLKSKDVQSIIHTIYIENLAHNSLEELKDNFCLLFSSYFEVEIEKCDSFASNLFNVLIEGCSLTLNKSVLEGNISAHDAKSQFRFNLHDSKLSYLIKLNESQKPTTSKLDLAEIEKQTIAFNTTYYTY
jgi:hypothetical protein